MAPPVPGRRSADSTEDARVARTRADVGRAALQVLTEESWDAITHAHVADVAGYSKTTLYTHWPSRLDLVTIALDAVGEMPHLEPTGELRTDLIAELTAFRRAVSDYKLDRILIVLAQWGVTVDEIRRIRERLVTEGERPLRSMLATVAQGPSFDAAVSMLSGVVVCATLMWDELPSDEVIAAAVDIVLDGV
ncbi:transcriptional regulator, TetR family [Williamsia sterculiae]|uniref:Transcriptional regulator, TetR family n=2 Tax=Williamsia sterculiae TaxID=1344003 RepID=A0A1N7H5F3_9NOCA|nr:transcriptional regulator, TetR family [Williamsia sterculiae]